jgi:hypothetical protein
MSIMSPFTNWGVYDEEVKMEYSLDHKDSMEVQMVEFIHASTKKARDMKRSYGKKIDNSL